MSTQAPILPEVERLEEDIASAIDRTMTAHDLGHEHVKLARDLGEAIGVVLASWGIWATAEGTITMERPADPPD
jgi:hypothetical protein